MTLILVADPMCSWCYGFAGQMAQAMPRLPEAALEIRMAGLWAGGQQVLDEAAKRFRLGHWARVEAAAGVAFNRSALLARQGFVYDTEPISRAFVAGRELAPRLDPLRLLTELQQAFYLDGLDTTDDAVLASVLARSLQRHGHAEQAARALTVLGLPELRASTRADFEQVRAWGLSSAPKLLARRPDGQISLLLDGFARAHEIVAAVRHGLQRQAPV
ncbi:DsbA family protein [Paucibacter soli]|uniref:DsbA family protein n=1 Tax=Paucibacter soli TaxID=3133433 RepID=UPI00309580F1